jgi:hypothetical protein
LSLTGDLVINVNFQNQTSIIMNYQKNVLVSFPFIYQNGKLVTPTLSNSIEISDSSTFQTNLGGVTNPTLEAIYTLSKLNHFIFRIW